MLVPHPPARSGPAVPPAHLTLGLMTDAQGQATPGANEQFEAARQESGMVNNMYREMGHEPALLAAYRETQRLFRTQAGFTRAEQEVVFLTVSRYNGCTYCMAAHSMLADLARVPAGVTDAIRTDLPIPDLRLAALARFTRELVAHAGRPPVGVLDDFLAAGYSQEQVLGVVLGISVMTMSNYTNHLFATPLDAVFQARAWDAPPVERREDQALVDPDA